MEVSQGAVLLGKTATAERQIIARGQLRRHGQVKRNQPEKNR
jgi:hypothetical protein